MKQQDIMQALGLREHTSSELRGFVDRLEQRRLGDR